MTHRIQDACLRRELEGIIRDFSTLSTEELKSLVECNAETLDQKFTDCEAAHQMEQTKSKLLENNLQTAQENLGNEQRFLDLRNTLLQMCHEAKQLKKSIEESETKAPSSVKSTNIDNLQSVLEAAARKAEDESEKIAESFLESSVTAEEFLATYIQSRCDSHLRRIRAEKVVELLHESRRAKLYPSIPTAYPAVPTVEQPLPQPYQPPQYPPMNYHSGNFMPPYPMYPPQGPMSMPTPGS